MSSSREESWWSSPRYVRFASSAVSQSLPADRRSRHDCCSERHPMVLRPWWPQRRPRTMQHLVPPLTPDADGIVLDALGVVGMDDPAALTCQFGQYLAIHHGIGSALVG